MGAGVDELDLGGWPPAPVGGGVELGVDEDKKLNDGCRPGGKCGGGG